MKTDAIKPIVAELPDAPAMVIATVCPTWADLKRFWWLNNSSEDAISAWTMLDLELAERHPNPEWN